MTLKHSPLTELIHAVLDGEASATEARELEMRLAADPAARAEFEGWKRLFEALNAMPRSTPRKGWSPRSPRQCRKRLAPPAPPANLFPAGVYLGTRRSEFPVQSPSGASR